MDNLDKGINLFSQKLREWYSWHFPELYPICSDNLTFATVARFVGDKSTLGDDKLHELAGLVGDDEEKAAEIILKAKMSMGRELGEVDLQNILIFAEKVQSLAGKARIRMIFYLRRLTFFFNQFIGELC